MTSRPAKAIRADLKTLRADMKLLGIKRTSCFNGGMSREAQRYNERMFALETEMQSAKRSEASEAALSDFNYVGSRHHS